MKSAKLTLGILLGIFAIGSAQAAQSATTSNVPLTGGDIGPKQQLNINLGNLIPNNHYTVSCNIHDDNFNTNPAKVMIYVPSGYANMGNITFNGKYVGANGTTQATLAGVDTDLKIINVMQWDSQYGTIAIRNLDQNDTIAVSDCQAVPEG